MPFERRWDPSLLFTAEYRVLLLFNHLKMLPEADFSFPLSSRISTRPLTRYFYFFFPDMFSPGNLSLALASVFSSSPLASITLMEHEEEEEEEEEHKEGARPIPRIRGQARSISLHLYEAIPGILELFRRVALPLFDLILSHAVKLRVI